MPVRIASDDDVRLYEEAMRVRQSYAQYHDLLNGKGPGVVYTKVRPGSGLVVNVVRHDALNGAQRQQLSEFRLHQYALCGWYDLPTLATRQFECDPAFDTLPGGTIHVLIGGPDGRLLAYFCMQPAAHSTPPSKDLLDELLDTQTQRRRLPTLCDPWRPLFCMEVESFGPDVFSSLPALVDMPVDAMRELSCLIRNQSITSPLSALATVEAVYTMAHVVMQPDSDIDVTLGCIDIEARRVTSVLGIPFLYAPLAPVIFDQFEYYWAHSVNAPGRFWPFVVSTDDLRTNAEHFSVLNNMLDGSSRDIRRGLIELRRHLPEIMPTALVPASGQSVHFWTADPYYSEDLYSEAAFPTSTSEYRDSVD